MADYPQTASLVLASTSAKRFQPTFMVAPVSGLSTSARPSMNAAGAVITAGQPVYQDPTTLAFYPCDANGADPLYKVLGFAENSAAIGQPVSIVTEDPYFTPGCTMVIGDIIIVSGTVGRICEAGDKANGWFVSILGVAYSTTQMNLKIIRSDVAKA